MYDNISYVDRGNEEIYGVIQKLKKIILGEA